MNHKLTTKAVLFSWTIVGLGALFYCYEYLLRASPSVMTQELMRFYHMTGAQYGNLSGSFYYWSYVIMQIIVGLLMDRYGPRRLLTIACGLCALGAYLFACSTHIEVAMVGRFMIGFGSAFAFVGAAKLATIWLPPERFALVSGIIFCLGMLGPVVGNIILHYLVDSMGWQVAIYVAGVVGVVLAIAIWMIVRDVNCYYENHISHETFTFREVLSGLGQALRNSQIWMIGAYGCLLYLFLSAYAELWGPSYLEQGRGLTPAHAVFANGLIFLGCAFGAPTWGWFSDLIGRRRLPIMISSISSFIIACFLFYIPDLSVVSIYVLSFIFGLTSSAQILVFAVAREMTPIKIAGTTIGLLNMLVMVGGIIFPPIVGKLLDINWFGTMVDGARVYSPKAFTIALSVIPIGALAGIIILCFVRETYCKLYVENH